MRLGTLTIEMDRAQAAEIVQSLSGQMLKGAVLKLVRELDRLLREGEMRGDA